MSTINILDTVTSTVSKNLDKILIGVGFAGVGAATGLTVFATIKSVKEVEKLAEDDEIHSRKDIIKHTWKYYVAPATIFACSMAALITAFYLKDKKIIGLASAGAAAEELAREAIIYKQKTKEMVGEEKEKEIQKASMEEYASKSSNIPISGSCVDEEQWFYDDALQKHFKSTLYLVMGATLSICQQIITDPCGMASLNDYAYALNINTLDDVSSDYLENNGWRIDSNPIAPRFSPQINSETGRTYILIHHPGPNRPIKLTKY